MRPGAPTGYLVRSLAATPAGNISRYVSYGGGHVKEIWHSQLGVTLGTGNTITSWTGQVSSKQMVAIPTYGTSELVTDGSYFGGKPVVQSGLTVTTNRLGCGISGMYGSGSSYCVVFRGRFRTVNSYTPQFVGNTAAIEWMFQANSGYSAIQVYCPAIAAPSIIGSGPIVTTPLTLVGYNQGTTHYFLIVGRSVVSGASTTGGVFRNSITNCNLLSPLSTGLLILMDAYPGASALTQITDLAASEFPG